MVPRLFPSLAARMLGARARRLLRFEIILSVRSLQLPHLRRRRAILTVHGDPGVNCPHDEAMTVGSFRKGGRSADFSVPKAWRIAPLPFYRAARSHDLLWTRKHLHPPTAIGG